MEFLQQRHVTIPEVALVAITRGLFGVGVGLLLADRLDREERRAIGRTLVMVGLVTTIPLLLQVFGAPKAPRQ